MFGIIVTSSICLITMPTVIIFHAYFDPYIRHFEGVANLIETDLVAFRCKLMFPCFVLSHIFASYVTLALLILGKYSLNVRRALSKHKKFGRHGRTSRGVRILYVKL